jgi:uncharacterized protein
MSRVVDFRAPRRYNLKNFEEASMKNEIFYWPRPGKSNTRSTIDRALRRARELKIKHAVIATCSGASARSLRGKADGIKVVAVSHQSGFARPGGQEMSSKARDFLVRRGVAVLTATHFFGGFGRAIRFKYGGLEPEETAANVLRIFGEGTKVAVEIAVMALDAGLIPYGRDVIALGGTGQGVDTALVCRPSHGKDFFNFEVREIVCKPRIRQR